MNCKKKRLAAICLALLLGAAMAGCGAEQQSGTTSQSLVAETTNTTLDTSDLFTDRDKEVGYDESTAITISLQDGGSTCDGEQVVIDGDTITIQDEGTYVLSGTLTNGQIIVDAEKTDKLQLVMHGVEINCDTSAALYVKQADKVFVTLESGTENTLSNQEDFVAIDDNNIDSVIFSKDDLTLNGSGSLTIQAAYGHGIVSKDDLVITGGQYEITAAGHALAGKDSVRIADGDFTLTAGKDGIHGENTEDATLGFLYIAGGTFDICSDGDGMDASSTLLIEDGIINCKTGGGSENAAEKQTDTMFSGKAVQQSDSTDTTDDTSTKGIKADGNLEILGGTITVDSADDAIHSNGNVTIQGGSFILETGDDGIHGDGAVEISGGSLQIAESYEGIEGQTIAISGGEITVVSSDDGLNAAGGNDQSGFGGKMPQDSFAADGDCWITISGGTIQIDADGDGIDSNGSLYVSGGEVYVSGPTNSGDGALDYNGEAQVTGGVVIAVGDSGMAQNFGSSSTQGAMLVNCSGSASDEIQLLDSSGNTIAAYKPEKAYSSVLISCPQLQEGESYTLVTGDTKTEITMTSLIYGRGGMQQGKGGMDGNMEIGGGRGDQPETPPGQFENHFDV